MYRILDWQLFAISLLSFSFHCFSRKLNVSLIIAFLKLDLSFLFLLSLQILSLSLAFYNFSMMYKCELFFFFWLPDFVSWCLLLILKRFLISLQILVLTHSLFYIYDSIKHLNFSYFYAFYPLFSIAHPIHFVLILIISELPSSIAILFSATFSMPLKPCTRVLNLGY